MPSIDPKTGKRLHGAQQQALAAARRFASETMRDLVEPPVDGPDPVKAVEAVEAWAAGLNLRAAQLARYARGADAEKLRWLVAVIRSLGQLKDKARRGMLALKVRDQRLGLPFALDAENPPYADPVAIVPWCFFELARLAYQVATSPRPPDEQLRQRARILGQAGFLPCNAALEAISDEVEKAG